MLSSLDRSAGTPPRVVADSPGAAIAAALDGGAWVAQFGISRLTLRDDESSGGGGDAAPDIDRFSQPDGLSGSVARDVLIDCEGNTWVATDAGLDRLRRRNLTWTPPRDNSLQTSLVAGPGLEVWALWWNEAIRRAQDGRPVPDAPAAKWWWGYHAPDDTILVGGETGLWRWRDGFVLADRAAGRGVRKGDALPRPRRDGGPDGPHLGIDQRRRSVPPRR